MQVLDGVLGFVVTQTGIASDEMPAWKLAGSWCAAFEDRRFLHVVLVVQNEKSHLPSGLIVEDADATEKFHFAVHLLPSVESVTKLHRHPPHRNPA